MYNLVTKSFLLPDGRQVTIETGKLAKQADGAVVVKLGDAMLLATVVSNKDAKEGIDFLPLSVDYQEKFASAGKIPGGFLRREARLSDYEVLISRLVDRALRPLFPDDYHSDTQVIINLISSDKNVSPDCLAGLAASASIAVSDIPFNGPISEVRVAKVNGQLVINPSPADIAIAEMELMVAASAKDIVMVEGEASEISEAAMLEAIKFAHEAIKVQCQAQVELAAAVGNKPKRTYNHETNDEALKQKIYAELYPKAYEVAKRTISNKNERGEAFNQIVKDYIAALPVDSTENKDLIKKYYHDVLYDAARNLVLDERVRLDGRKTDQIRGIWSEVGYLPGAHGSSVFTRGETQSLTTVTLGTKLDEQIIDSATLSGTNRFMLHYNFPSFSTGEARPNRGTGRREVGHGNLALRALKKVLPPDSENPYTIRVVSDILESNGSSSMATVCAGTLALMDAGIKISSPVSGIAMGLITDEKTGKYAVLSDILESNGSSSMATVCAGSLALMDAGIKISGPVSGIAMGMISDSSTKKYAILSDILGDEDHLGDMDFKVTGTEKGITACQMDLKVNGLSYSILEEALAQARNGRLHILGEMKKTIAQPNADLKPHAPRSVTIVVEKEFIGAIIGPGGKIIQEIQRTTGATVVIEEVNNQGVVNVFAVDKTSLDAAVRRIKDIVAIPEIGEVYEGKVKSIMPFGAFVEFMPGKDGLLHISEIKWERLETMDGVFQDGEIVKVKLLDVDKKTGKFKLSRKVLLPKPETASQN